MLAPLQSRDTVSQGSKHVLGGDRKMAISVGISFNKTGQKFSEVLRIYLSESIVPGPKFLSYTMVSRVLVENSGNSILIVVKSL